MARLTLSERNAFEPSKFAGPNRSFPINDATHARLAISGATRSEWAGNITPAEEAAIKAKAKAALSNRGWG